MSSDNGENGTGDKLYDRPQDTVAARCFELLDENGKLVAFVRCEQDVPHIGLVGRDDEVRTVISWLGGQGRVHPAHLEIATGDYEMSELSIEVSTPSIALRDTDGNDRLVCRLDPDGHPRIVCLDKDGTPAPPRWG